MDPSHTAKYIASGLIMASLFALVILGKVDVQAYEALAFSALAGLGVGATVAMSRQAPPQVVVHAAAPVPVPPAPPAS